MKTYQQILNELKISTMGNYVKKASEDVRGTHSNFLDYHDKKYNQKQVNRIVGVRRAKEKIKKKMANLKIVHKGTVH